MKGIERKRVKGRRIDSPSETQNGDIKISHKKVDTKLFQENVTIKGYLVYYDNTRCVS